MKRILSFALAAVMAMSALPVAYAAEGEHDYSNGTQITLVGTQENQGAQWTVTVPAKMQPGQTGTVTAQGTWAADQFIRVHAPKTVTLTYGAQSMDVAIHFTRDSWDEGITDCGFSQIGSNTEEITATATVHVADTSRLFGTWEGILEYEVALIENCDVNRDGMITMDDYYMIVNVDESPLTDEQERYADIDGDGMVNYMDMWALQEAIEGYCNPLAVNAVQPVETVTFTWEKAIYNEEKGDNDYCILSYSYEDGMTWEEWVGSEYNDGTFAIVGNCVQGQNCVSWDGNTYSKTLYTIDEDDNWVLVQKTDEIYPIQYQYQDD